MDLVLLEELPCVSVDDGPVLEPNSLSSILDVAAAGFEKGSETFGKDR